MLLLKIMLVGGTKPVFPFVENALDTEILEKKFSRILMSVSGKPNTIPPSIRQRFTVIPLTLI